MQPDGSLVISHVAVEDSGFYTCVAFNGQDRDQRWVQLRVLGKAAVPSGRASVASGPEVRWGGISRVVDGASSLGPGELTITGLPSTMTVPEGDTARLLCVVSGESVNIRWSR